MNKQGFHKKKLGKTKIKP